MPPLSISPLYEQNFIFYESVHDHCLVFLMQAGKHRNVPLVCCLLNKLLWFLHAKKTTC